MSSPGPVQTHSHVRRAAGLRGIRAEVKRVEGVNAKIAVLITEAVGTMAMAYAFSLLALLSLPAILTEAHWVAAGTFPSSLVAPGLILVISWLAQTFIQLVLLAVIMVGQSVQARAADARSVATYRDTELLIKHAEATVDALRLDTEGGLAEVVAAIKKSQGAILRAMRERGKETPRR